MGLNRLMLSKKAGGGGTTGDFIMTMGQHDSYYGYSNFGGTTYGEVTGDVTHDGKAVTLMMLYYYYSNSSLSLAFKVEGVTSGSYNVTVKVTSMETNTTVSIEFPNVGYFLPPLDFVGTVNNPPADITSLFVAANVGKKFKVELIFN